MLILFINSKMGPSAALHVSVHNGLLCYYDRFVQITKQ